MHLKVIFHLFTIKMLQRNGRLCGFISRHFTLSMKITVRKAAPTVILRYSHLITFQQRGHPFSYIRNVWKMGRGLNFLSFDAHVLN